MPSLGTGLLPAEMQTQMHEANIDAHAQPPEAHLAPTREQQDAATVKAITPVIPEATSYNEKVARNMAVAQQQAQAGMPMSDKAGVLNPADQANWVPGVSGGRGVSPAHWRDSNLLPKQDPTKPESLPYLTQNQTAPNVVSANTEIALNKMLAHDPSLITKPELLFNAAIQNLNAHDVQKIGTYQDMYNYYKNVLTQPDGYNNAAQIILNYGQDHPGIAAATGQAIGEVFSGFGLFTKAYEKVSPFVGNVLKSALLGGWYAAAYADGDNPEVKWSDPDFWTKPMSWAGTRDNLSDRQIPGTDLIDTPNLMSAFNSAKNWLGSDVVKPGLNFVMGTDISHFMRGVHDIRATQGNAAADEAVAGVVGMAILMDFFGKGMFSLGGKFLLRKIELQAGEKIGDGSLGDLLLKAHQSGTNEDYLRFLARSHDWLKTLGGSERNFILKYFAKKGMEAENPGRIASDMAENSPLINHELNPDGSIINRFANPEDHIGETPPDVDLMNPMSRSEWLGKMAGKTVKNSLGLASKIATPGIRHFRAPLNLDLASRFLFGDMGFVPNESWNESWKRTEDGSKYVDPRTHLPVSFGRDVASWIPGVRGSSWASIVSGPLDFLTTLNGDPLNSVFGPLGEMKKADQAAMSFGGIGIRDRSDVYKMAITNPKVAKTMDNIVSINQEAQKTAKQIATKIRSDRRATLTRLQSEWTAKGLTAEQIKVLSKKPQYRVPSENQAIQMARKTDARASAFAELQRQYPMLAIPFTETTGTKIAPNFLEILSQQKTWEDVVNRFGDIAEAHSMFLPDRIPSTTKFMRAKTYLRGEAVRQQMNKVDKARKIGNEVRANNVSYNSKIYRGSTSLKPVFFEPLKTFSNQVGKVGDPKSLEMLSRAFRAAGMSPLSVDLVMNRLASARSPKEWRTVYSNFIQDTFHTYLDSHLAELALKGEHTQTEINQLRNIMLGEHKKAIEEMAHPFGGPSAKGNYTGSGENTIVPLNSNPTVSATYPGAGLVAAHEHYFAIPDYRALDDIFRETLKNLRRPETRQALLEKSSEMAGQRFDKTIDKLTEDVANQEKMLATNPDVADQLAGARLKLAKVIAEKAKTMEDVLGTEFFSKPRSFAMNTSYYSHWIYDKAREHLIDSYFRKMALATGSFSLRVGSGEALGHIFRFGPKSYAESALASKVAEGLDAYNARHGIAIDPGEAKVIEKRVIDTIRDNIYDFEKGMAEGLDLNKLVYRLAQDQAETGVARTYGITADHRDPRGDGSESRDAMFVNLASGKGTGQFVQATHLDKDTFQALYKSHRDIAEDPLGSLIAKILDHHLNPSNNVIGRPSEKFFVPETEEAVKTYKTELEKHLTDFLAKNNINLNDFEELRLLHTRESMAFDAQNDFIIKQFTLNKDFSKKDLADQIADPSTALGAENERLTKAYKEAYKKRVSKEADLEGYKEALSKDEQTWTNKNLMGFFHATRESGDFGPDWAATINRLRSSAIKQYTKASGRFNHPLRAGIWDGWVAKPKTVNEYAKRAAQIDKAMVPVSETYYVNRDVGMDSTFGDDESVMPHQLDGRIHTPESLVPGAIMHDPGYQSTMLDGRFASGKVRGDDGWAERLTLQEAVDQGVTISHTWHKIIVPPGSKAAYIQGHNEFNEKELLLGRNTSSVVTKVEVRINPSKFNGLNGTLVIYSQVVPNPKNEVFTSEIRQMTELNPKSKVNQEGVEWVPIDEVAKNSVMDARFPVSQLQEDSTKRILQFKVKLKKDGFEEPLVIKEHLVDGKPVTYLEDGEHRLAAARELGLSHVPVRVNSEVRPGAMPSDLMNVEPMPQPPRSLTIQERKKLALEEATAAVKQFQKENPSTYGNMERFNGIRPETETRLQQELREKLGLGQEDALPVDQLIKMRHAVDINGEVAESLINHLLWLSHGRGPNKDLPFDANDLTSKIFHRRVLSMIAKGESPKGWLATRDLYTRPDLEHARVMQAMEQNKNAGSYHSYLYDATANLHDPKTLLSKPEQYEWDALRPMTPDMAHYIRRMVKENGGITIDARTGFTPPVKKASGYMVSDDKFSATISPEDFKTDPVRAINAYLLANQHRLTEEGAFLGLWASQTGVYFDISSQVFDEKEAEALSIARNQEGYWSYPQQVKTGDGFVPTGGSGGTPETIDSLTKRISYDTAGNPTTVRGPSAKVSGTSKLEQQQLISKHTYRPSSATGGDSSLAKHNVTNTFSDPDKVTSLFPNNIPTQLAGDGHSLAGILSGLADKVHDTVSRRVIDGLSRKPLYALELNKQLDLEEPLVQAGLITQEQASNRARQNAVLSSIKYIHNPQDRMVFEQWARGLAPFWFAKNQAFRRAARFASDNPAGFVRYVRANMAVMKQGAMGTQNADGRSSLLVPGSMLGGRYMTDLLNAFNLSPVGGVPIGLTGATSSLASVLPFSNATGSNTGTPMSAIDMLKPDFGPLVSLPIKLWQSFQPYSQTAQSTGEAVLGGIGNAESYWTMALPNAPLRNVLSTGLSAMGTKNGITAQIDSTQVGLMQEELLQKVQQWRKEGAKQANQLWNEVQQSDPASFGPAQKAAFIAEAEEMYARQQETQLLNNPNEVTAMANDSHVAAMILHLGQTALSSMSPLSLSATQVNPDLQKFITAALNVSANPQKLDEIYKAHPDTLDFMARSTKSNAGVPLPATMDMWNFQSQNQDLFQSGKYNGGLIAFVPWSAGGSAYDSIEYHSQLNSGIRKKFFGTDFLGQAAISEGNNMVYNILKPFVDKYYGGDTYKLAEMKKQYENSNPLLKASLGKGAIARMQAYAEVKKLLNNPEVMRRPDFKKTGPIVQKLVDLYEGYNAQAHGYGIQKWYKDQLQSDYVAEVEKILKDNPIATVAGNALFLNLNTDYKIPTS